MIIQWQYLLKESEWYKVFQKRKSNREGKKGIEEREGERKGGRQSLFSTLSHHLKTQVEKL